MMGGDGNALLLPPPLLLVLDEQDNDGDDIIRLAACARARGDGGEGGGYIRYLRRAHPGEERFDHPLITHPCTSSKSLIKMQKVGRCAGAAFRLVQQSKYLVRLVVGCEIFMRVISPIIDGTRA